MFDDFECFFPSKQTSENGDGVSEFVVGLSLVELADRGALDGGFGVLIVADSPEDLFELFFFFGVEGVEFFALGDGKVEHFAELLDDDGGAFFLFSCG